MPDTSKIIASALDKHRQLVTSPSRYSLRSVLAGMYLAIIVMVFWALANNLGASPFGKVLASGFFGVGLSVIVFTKTELFTSNAMYMAAASFARRLPWRDTLRLWAVCYFGNLVGACVVALLLWGAGVFEDLPATHALFTGAAHKAHQTAAVIFFKGILANWIVCLAVAIALRLDSDLARLSSMILVVFIFLYLGFEHSIANMATFAYSLLGKGTITLADVIFNLVFSTAGNVVGGAMLAGLPGILLETPREECSSSGDIAIPDGQGVGRAGIR